MKFTLYKIKGANESIKKDIDTIVKTIKNNFFLPNIMSIVLTGSFGWGEGGIIKKHGKSGAVNDYDILIVSLFPLNRKKLKKIEKELKEKFSLRFVDIAYTLLPLLPFKKLTMHMYDIKHGAATLYGAPISRFMPNYPKGKLPEIEGEVLFRHRLICPFELDIKKDRLKFLLQVTKTVIACATLLLINEGKYSHSYLKRYEMAMKSKNPFIKNNKELIKQAFLLKLHGTNTIKNAEQFFKKTLYFTADIFELVYGKDLKNAFESYKQKTKQIAKEKRMLIPNGINRYNEIDTDTIKLIYALTKKHSLLKDLRGKYGVKSNKELFSKITKNWMNYHHG
ncbi:hypothetical protein ACFLZ7_00370 [Nanoarchaeota archaeon]